MRVVAISSDRVDDGEGVRIEPSTVAQDVDADELVLVHDAAAAIDRAAIDDIVEQAVAGVDLLVGAWTFADPDHGIVDVGGSSPPNDSGGRTPSARRCSCPAVPCSGAGGRPTRRQPCTTCCSG